MIKVVDEAALKLIAPAVDWNRSGSISIETITDNPPAINYIDCSVLDANQWYCLMIRCPQFEDLCTEYGGWGMMGKYHRMFLLEEYPQFEKYFK